MAQATQKPDALKSLVSDARSAADSAERTASGTVVAGPFEVGKIGHVQVIERELGSSGQKYLYAEFTGHGRPSRIPLAAVSVLAEKIA